MQVSKSVWLSPRDLEQPGMRLFCLPHAGSGAAGFYRWKRLLPPSIAVCPVMLPGREARLSEPALTSCAAIVEELTVQAGPHTDRSYSIFGHSMGALLAYEWARRISRAPVCLFASGRKAPQLETSHRGLHRLPEEEFIDELKRRYGGEPEALLQDPEMRGVFLPILRSDLQVVEDYEWSPGPKLSFDVCATAGVEDRSVSDDELARWAEVTSGGFSSRRFAGDHFYHFGAGQAELLRFIAETMERFASGAR